MCIERTGDVGSHHRRDARDQVIHSSYHPIKLAGANEYWWKCRQLLGAERYAAISMGESSRRIGDRARMRGRGCLGKRK